MTYCTLSFVIIEPTYNTSAPAVLANYRSHWTCEDRWEGLCAGPQALASPNEEGHREPAQQTPWAEGHAQACGPRLCCSRSQLQWRPKQHAPPSNQTTHCTVWKAPGQVVEHQLLFKHEPRKAPREAATLALSDSRE